MRIAITGAAGYIGPWLHRSFMHRGHLTHRQDRVPVPRTSSAVFDLADNGRRREWLSDIRPDIVVHLAALYGRVWGEKDLVATAAVNAGITAELARDTAKAGARLMYVSSSEVYGTAASGTVTPDSPLDPLNMYGLTKKWGEEAARAYAPDGLMITRLNMPYGPALDHLLPGERPHSSGVPGTIGYNVLHSMLWQAAHSMPITVHRGTERCFTWVGDAMAGLVTVAESGRSGTWNVSRNDAPVTMADLAKRCVALVPGCRSEITEVQPGSQVTPRKSLDNAALLGLGWKPAVGLDEGMPRALEYFRRFGTDGRWAG